MLSSQGHEFQCHKTVARDDEGGDDDAVRQTDRDQHCAGALIFAESKGTATQMMRISERLGAYDPAVLMADKAVVASVFGSLTEMLASAVDTQAPLPKRQKTGC